MINTQTLSTWWEIFKAPDSLTEVRILGDGNATYSGYFRDKETMIAEIQRCGNLGGIYAAINEINPDCYGRKQYNRIVKHPKATTNDNDIIRRRILFIDFDPKRPSDTNSTDAQLKLAEERMKAVVRHLRDVGFPNPVIAMSGNGYHCYYKIDLPNDSETKALLERFFQSLDKTFGGNGVDIDNTVFNASRIAKIIGATSTKGANTPERPQRESVFTYIPPSFKEVAVELIRRVADEYPVPEKHTRATSAGKSRFPIDEFLEKHGIEVARRQPFNGGEKIVLAACPFDQNHKDFALFIYDDGGVAATCFHNSCREHGWRDFIEHYEPDYFENNRQQYDRQQPGAYSAKKPPKPVPEDDRGKKWKRASEIEYVDPNSIVFIPSGMKKFDERSRGLALGEFSILTGLSGAGKSTILNHFILSARQSGFKSAIWSGELVPQMLISWLDQVAAGRNFVKPSRFGDDNYYTPQNVCKEINEWLGDYLFIYNNDYGEKWSQLLADITECVRSNGVKLVLIDNLMSLTLDTFDGDKNEKQSLFAKGLASLAKAEQIHIVLVCHPRKEQSFQLLRKESIAGTADLTNACDNLFILHRGGIDFEKRAKEFFGEKRAEEMVNFDLVLEVNKNRRFGKVDFLDGLFYEKETRRVQNFPGESVTYGWVKTETQQPSLLPKSRICPTSRATNQTNHFTTTSNMKRFKAYTDGYFDMNTQVGSSACVILSDDGVKLYEHAKARRCEEDPAKKQRNNEQELGAIIRAVMSVPNGCELFVYSDSTYAVNVLSGRWNASANLGLIDRYNEEVKKRHLRVQLFWVKGHDNGKCKWNEYADELCERVAASLMSGGPSLFRSPKNLRLEPCES